jgi:hypothetical protein
LAAHRVYSNRVWRVLVISYWTSRVPNEIRLWYKERQDDDESDEFGRKKKFRKEEKPVE